MKILKQIALVNLLLLGLSATSHAKIPTLKSTPHSESISVIDSNLSLQELQNAVKIVMDNYGRQEITRKEALLMQPLGNPDMNMPTPISVTAKPGIVKYKETGPNPRMLFMALTQRDGASVEIRVDLKHRPLRAHLPKGSGAAYKLAGGHITEIVPNPPLTVQWSRLQMDRKALLGLIVSSVQAGIKAINVPGRVK